MSTFSTRSNMAATAAVNRPPPAHPGPNGGNLHTRANCSGPTSQQQDPRLHGTNQDPGPSSHPPHHVYGRPFLYVPAPPPPPFLHYQWPMPFSYNPFAGFPGMGYGMVMPQFPPPLPYMEAPAYIMPHPHVQPVDYRRLLHPQVHAPSAPYQNPNQAHRVRLPHTGPIRETVNCEVQTEPTRRGHGSYDEESPLVRSDSGRGSPSSSSSSSQKRSSAEVENYTLPSSNANDTQVKRTGTVKHGFNALHPTKTKTVQSCIRGTLEKQKSRKDSVGQENVPPCRNGHCNMWSVGSSGSMVPVCTSSQQEEEVVKERRISVPDILMSWGGSTPQAAMLQMAEKLAQNDHQLPSYRTEVKHDKSVNQSPTESKNGPMADCADANDAESNLSSTDSATHSKIPKLREAHEEQKANSRRENEPVGLVGIPYRDELLHSLNTSHKLPDNEQENGNETNPHEDTTDITPYQKSFNSFQMKRKMNESVWSVESLAPCIPTKEWLLHNSTFEPEVIVEMTEDVENGTPLTLIVKASKERRRTRRRCSFSDSVLMSDSWLIYNTPPEKQSLPKKPEIESDIDASEIRPKQVQSTAPSEKDPLASPTRLPQSQIVLSTPTEEDDDKNSSFEPEANRSPNQESLIVNEQQEKSACSPEQEETPLLNSAAGLTTSTAGQNRVEMEDRACGNEEVGQLRNEQLCVPMADQKMAEVSPSKGHLVDCGIQCIELQQCASCNEKIGTGPVRRQFLNIQM
ncbi:uncharacterized protein LOC119499472 [Sebastes umbrosus]|uniref:uncharacterized protein LOC119499472 n=1 Tax=Sebastes umbrosus TaxID=72105 RepID=UPI0018A0B0A7|nr:uncharacterized protein LOC119499472 [Sebastes umbrosus]XP_037644727.1 uncharacterized protein LOC119499472 [Sebastes umbrosus]